jgi:hypothetical protein
MLPNSSMWTSVTDMRSALDPRTPVIHPTLGDNLAFERTRLMPVPSMPRLPVLMRLWMSISSSGVTLA